MAKLLLSSPQATAVSHPGTHWSTWGMQRSSEGHGAPQSDTVSSEGHGEHRRLPLRPDELGPS